jgi:gas vesicle protein
MRKKGSFLASAALGGVLTGATLFWLSPKLSRTFKKDAQKKLAELADSYPEAVDFIKERAANALDLLQTIKDSLSEEEDFLTTGELLSRLKNKSHHFTKKIEEETSNIYEESYEPVDDIILRIDDLDGTNIS